jgi:hypothetical protein
MVVNRLQKGLINLRIAPRVSRPNCQNITNSNRDFYYEKNNVSQVQLTYQKFKKKKKLKMLLSSTLKLRSAQSHMLLFVICFSS